VGNTFCPSIARGRMSSNKRQRMTLEVDISASFGQ
jgi:hypothetical protein